MGILLGYVLRITKDHVIKLTNKQLNIGWYFSIGCLLFAFFSPAPMGDIDYKYNPTHAAFYAAITPIAWCIFFIWIIFLSESGYSSKFITFFITFLLNLIYFTDKFIQLLEWRVFKVFTRFSYSFYLTQFPIFFVNVGTLRSSLYFRMIPTILNLNEYIVIVIISILLTLFVEMPCSNLKTLILDRKNTKTVKNCKIEGEKVE
jgi:peptidoglycan/LPS O-acetylase OafA/YrhL